MSKVEFQGVIDVHNHSELRDRNTAFIFRVIHEEGPISRTGIVERTGLSPSTVSVITAELQKHRFIHECGRDASHVGRPAVLLEVNPRGGYFLTADLAPEGISVGVVDLSLTPVIKHVYHEVSETGEALYHQLVNALKDLQDMCTVQGQQVLGVGVATPGLISQRGYVIEADNLGWKEFDLKTRLERDVHDVVVVENDSNAAASGEFQCGSYRDKTVQNMLYVSVDEGVGCGLILQRALFSGSMGFAGELGHICATGEGPLCACGRKGCLESVASGPAMLRTYQQRQGKQADVHDVDGLIEHAEAGDEAARAIMTAAARQIGRAVGNLVNILNVDLVVLGGKVPLASPFFFDTVEQTARDIGLQSLQNGCAFYKSSLGQEAGLIGVASLGLVSMFN